MTKNSRIESLDSLRGLASLSVVIHHSLLVLPLFFLAHIHEVNNTFVKIITNSPLHMLWGGHEAVLLFFVLSGFVLALPFLNNRQESYPSFAIKRFCRIYIPYIVSIALSAILYNLINPTEISETSSNFNGMWSHQVSFTSIISYILMLGFDSFNLNGVTWSLVHEMRISIFFPFLMLFVLKWNWKKILFVGISISLFLWSFLLISSDFIGNSTIKYLLISFGDTFYYASFFVMGAAFAKYRECIISFLKPLKKVKIVLFIIFILLYNIEWISFGISDLKYSDSLVVSNIATMVIDFIIGISVVILFSLVISSIKLNSVLNNKALINLGKISYSLYLVHIIVILTMIHTLNPYLPISLILIFVPIVSILTAIPFYLFIEKPSMKFGKFLTKHRILNKRTKTDGKMERA